MNVTQRLIEHFDGIGQTAQAFGIGREALRLWRRRGVPLSRALDVEKRTGGAITAEEVINEAREAERLA